MLSNIMVRKLHIVALLLLAMPLIGAFGIQIFMHELPCPLCLLQRIGMIGIAIGLLMNLRFGIHPLHYGISIVSALIGAAVSTRQILLHIVPSADGVTGYGDAVLGMHLYTWALIVFLASILGIAFFMILMKWSDNLGSESVELNSVEKGILVLFLVLALGNTLGVFLECGLQPCPDNPTQYLF